MPFYSYLEGGVKFFVGLLQILNDKTTASIKKKTVFFSKIERACDYSFFHCSTGFFSLKFFTAKGEMQFAYA